MNFIPILLLLSGGVILTAGDIIMKKWVSTNAVWFYLAGMAYYIVGMNFLAQSYKFKNIAVASTMLVIFNVVILAFISWLYFKESLSIYQVTGIVLGLSAIVFLEMA